LLRAATGNGHAAIGQAGGRLEAGAPADLVTIELESVRLAGAVAETALESAVFAASAADVRDVIVGGRQVVSEGRHADLDVAAELRASIAEAYA
jgi:cytosine/adenosine deaminase-related metal-dependent hydrolase